MAQLVRLGFATFPAPMLSIPASSHFFGHIFRVEPEERSDFGAMARMAAQKDQFAPFPVCQVVRSTPSWRAASLVDRPYLRRVWSSRSPMVVGAGKGS